MKFAAADQPFADPEKAARKLIENATQSVQDGRIHIELLNLPFLRADGSVEEYRAGLECAISNRLADPARIGRLCEVHPGGHGYVRLGGPRKDLGRFPRRADIKQLSGNPGLARLFS